MNLSVCVCCLSLLLLLVPTGAKPQSELQTLQQLLEEEVHAAPYHPSTSITSITSTSSEEQEQEQESGVRTAAVGAPHGRLWDSAGAPAAAAEEESAAVRLLKDLLRTNKRSSSRYKKGGLRSCFGVRLERIGSFSGLGC